MHNYIGLNSECTYTGFISIDFIFYRAPLKTQVFLNIW